jgi:hypothetical protein
VSEEEEEEAWHVVIKVSEAFLIKININITLT